MKEFKNVIIRCKKDDDFSHSRNVNYSCGCDFMINADDVFCTNSVGYFGEEIKEYYTICPVCGYINMLDEKRLPDEVKKMANYSNIMEPFQYKKNNLRSELIYLDNLGSSKVLKKVR